MCALSTQLPLESMTCQTPSRRAVERRRRRAVAGCCAAGLLPECSRSGYCEAVNGTRHRAVFSRTRVRLASVGATQNEPRQPKKRRRMKLFFRGPSRRRPQGAEAGGQVRTTNPNSFPNQILNRHRLGASRHAADAPDESGGLAAPVTPRCRQVDHASRCSRLPMTNSACATPPGRQGALTNGRLISS